MTGFSTRTENITPKKAEKYLEKCTARQRRVSGHRVRYYANMIARGEFRHTAQGIVFDSNGHLIDGQHRLHAVIKADSPVKMQVTRGEKPDNYDVYDDVGARSVADRTQLHSHEFVRTLLTRVINRMVQVHFGYKNKIINAYYYDTYEQHKEQMDAVCESICPHRARIFKDPSFLLAMVEYFVINQEMAEIMLEEVIEGDNLDKYSPSKVLRDYLMLQSGLTRERKDSHDDTYAKVVAACRAHQRGKDLPALKKSKWSDGAFESVGWVDIRDYLEDDGEPEDEE